MKSRMILLWLLVLTAALPVVLRADEPLGGRPTPGLPAAADPDTVVAQLVFPAGAPLPTGIDVQPDTLLVGRPASLILDFDPAVLPDEVAAWLDSVTFSQEWLFQDGTAQAESRRPGRWTLPVRVYQINPFRLKVGTLSTAVKLVDVRAQGTQDTAAIRDPRRWGWNLFTLLVGAALLTALLLGGWWLWTARKVATEKLPDWPVPPPAWMGASRALDALLSDGLLDRGELRLFLDRLAGITRHYLAGRFRVGAVEMTPPEIEAACRARAHPAALTGPFLDILEQLDSCRYDPSPADPAFCRHSAWRFYAAMEQARVLPQYTPVPAEEILAADQAWARSGEILAAYRHPPAAAYDPDREGGR